MTTLIALLAGLSYPSASAGLDTLRLRSAADQVVSFLNIALDRADRRQQVVEIRISQAENTIAARSSDSNFARSLEVPEPVRIIGIEPPLINVIGPEPPRRFLVYPGGAVPRIAIYLASKEGRKRRVIVDPVTGMIHSEAGIK